MRFAAALLTLAVTVAGCTSESSLPTPSGEGRVRAINAIQNSPTIRYLNEERLQASLEYKQASDGRLWDDFDYTFNFEYTPFGETEPVRIASQFLDVEAGRDYTLVLSGTLGAATVTVWEASNRVFDPDETVFEARFAHTAPALGSVDVYFAPPGTAPVLGMAVGTLAPGEILDPLDFAAGDYVLTLTTAGDPSDVVYETDTVTYDALNSFILPIFDGNALDVAPFNIRRLNALGGAVNLADIRVPPTVRFFHASIDLPPSDVYDDEMLTNQVLSNHAFGDVTGDIPVDAGVNSYTYTAVGNTGAIQFESGIDVAAGTHNNFIVIGPDGDRVATTFVPDRRRVATLARLSLYAAAFNHETLDLYVVDRGATIDDTAPTARVVYSLLSGPFVFAAGSYDFYLTLQDEKTIVAGPVEIDLANGDFVETLVLDTVDPATADLRVLPTP